MASTQRNVKLLHPKKFKLLNPEQWGLNPSKTFVATQTMKGYAIRISKTDWIGLPKSLVERQNGIFKPLNSGSKKS